MLFAKVAPGDIYRNMFFKSSDILRMTFKDLMGQRFGRLVAISKEGRSKGREIIWMCLCDCGNLRTAVGSKLTNGSVQPCGCLQKDKTREANITHGKSHSRIYSIWKNMLSRCTNSNHDSYSNYGGRDIQVCDRWLKFENFLADMGEPAKDLTIDRIELDGNYEPGNCRWRRG